MKAIWNGVIVADSEDTVVVEGNHYFPAASVKAEHLLHSNTRRMCSLKGETHYYNLFVDGDVLPDGVWHLPEPYEAAAELKGRLAFAHGVRIEE
jgi:uncharacterized protein (DUF427 family)